MYVLRFRDIPREAEARVRMTVYLLPVSVQRQASSFLNGEYGFMVGIKNREIIKVPLEEVAGKLKMVSPDASIVQEAKMLGICFGD